MTDPIRRGGGHKRLLCALEFLVGSGGHRDVSFCDVLRAKVRRKLVVATRINRCGRSTTMRTKRVEHPFAVGAAPTEESMAVNPDQFAHERIIKLSRFGINMPVSTGDKDFWIVDVVGNFCFVH